jgi:hypothetical protein
MNDEAFNESVDEATKNLQVMRIRTRIAELKGTVAAGRSLTSAETKELRDLETQLLTLIGHGGSKQ